MMIVRVAIMERAQPGGGSIGILILGERAENGSQWFDDCCFFLDGRDVGVMEDGNQKGGNKRIQREKRGGMKDRLASDQPLWANAKKIAARVWHGTELNAWYHASDATLAM